MRHGGFLNCQHGNDRASCLLCRLDAQVADAEPTEAAPEPQEATSADKPAIHPSACLHNGTGSEFLLDRGMGTIECLACNTTFHTATELYDAWILKGAHLFTDAEYQKLKKRIEALPKKWQKETEQWRERATKALEASQELEAINGKLVEGVLRLCDAAGVERTVPIADGQWRFEVLVREIAKLRDQVSRRKKPVSRVGAASEIEQRGGEKA